VVGIAGGKPFRGKSCGILDGKVFPAVFVYLPPERPWRRIVLDVGAQGGIGGQGAFQGAGDVLQPAGGGELDNSPWLWV